MKKVESEADSLANVRTRVLRYRNGESSADDDALAVEEPLEIAVATSEATHMLSVTLRTPGADEDLVRGFLFSEGVIRSRDELKGIEFREEAETTLPAKRAIARLRSGIVFDEERHRRLFPISAACGACGKSALEALKVFRDGPFALGALRVEADALLALVDQLRPRQSIFSRTGGLHASARFGADCRLIAMSEDIGRHNALDKLVGSSLESEGVDWSEQILLLSGRVGFDLMQKAIGAGCAFVASIGAPSSLAVELANLYDMTLVGFLRDGRFNVYSGPDRLRL